MLKSEYLQHVYTQVVTRDPDQREFHQAVLEVLESLDLIVDQHPEYEKHGIIETFVEPERDDFLPRALGGRPMVKST